MRFGFQPHLKGSIHGVEVGQGAEEYRVGSRGGVLDEMQGPAAFDSALEMEHEGRRMGKI